MTNCSSISVPAQANNLAVEITSAECPDAYYDAIQLSKDDIADFKKATRRENILLLTKMSKVLSILGNEILINEFEATTSEDELVSTFYQYYKLLCRRNI